MQVPGSSFVKAIAIFSQKSDCFDLLRETYLNREILSLTKENEFKFISQFTAWSFDIRIWAR